MLKHFSVLTSKMQKTLFNSKLILIFRLQYWVRACPFAFLSPELDALHSNVFVIVLPKIHNFLR